MTIIEQAIDHYNYGISHDIFSEPVTTYAKLSIEALKKQIPEKVVCSKYFYGYTYHCPSCSDQVGKGAYGVNDVHCPNCGQALDWSDSQQ